MLTGRGSCYYQKKNNPESKPKCKFLLSHRNGNLSTLLNISHLLNLANTG